VKCILYSYILHKNALLYSNELIGMEKKWPLITDIYSYDVVVKVGCYYIKHF